MFIWIGAISQGLGYAFLILGVYLTFRILDFPDLTVDGSLVTGAALTGILLVNDVHPAIAMPVSFFIGSLAGLMTGLIHTKLKVAPLLSGILTATSLYSINLHIMGRSNLPLLNETTFVTLLNKLNLPMSEDLTILLFFLILVMLFRFLLVWFLHTDLGLALRATGDNDAMITAQGTNTDLTKIFGISLSNGMVALSGSLLAQYQGFVDVGMGIGMLVSGIASVIIGETFFGKKGINLIITGVILGSVFFRLLIALSLKVGLNPIDLKLVTAIFVLIALALPRIKTALGKTKPQGRLL
ncbi:MAG: ABC transporter permease [Fidelibacterota bacterium]